jgi:hypothetical protein
MTGKLGCREARKLHPPKASRLSSIPAFKEKITVQI